MDNDPPTIDPANLDDLEIARIPLGGHMALDGQPQGLGDDERQSGEDDGKREASETILPAVAAAAHDGEQDCARSHGSCGEKACAAVRVNRQMTFPALQTCQRLTGGGFDGLRGNATVEEEPGWVGSADEHRPWVAGAQQMDGRVLEAMIAPHAGDRARSGGVLRSGQRRSLRGRRRLYPEGDAVWAVPSVSLAAWDRIAE